MARRREADPHPTDDSAGRRPACPPRRSSRVGSCCAALVPALTLAACGGASLGGSSGNDWIFPLTVGTDVAVADVDGDGRPDVLTLEQLATSQDQRQGRLLVYRQQTAGTFSAPEVHIVGVYPWRLSLGDIDGDGALDVIVTDVGSDAVWLLWQRSGSPGQFETPVQLASGIHAYGVAVADLNGDGALDIAIPAAGTARQSVLVIHRSATQSREFTPPLEVALPSPCSNVIAGDLNGDGHADLVAAMITSGGGTTPPTLALGYLPQLADGAFGPLTPISWHTGLNLQRMAVADQDGDGALDLLAYLTPYSSDFESTLTVVQQGPLAGAFRPQVDSRLVSINGKDDAAFADLNRDGRPDTAVGGFFPVGSPSKVYSRVNVFIQAGGGSFALAAAHDIPVPVSAVAAADLNGDGATDIVGFAAADGCQVLFQSPTVPGLFSDPRPLR